MLKGWGLETFKTKRPQRRGSASSYREQVNLCAQYLLLPNPWTFDCLIMLSRFLLNSKFRFSVKLLHSLAKIYGADLHPATHLVTAIIHCVYQIPGARLICMDLTRPPPLACSGWGLAHETKSSRVVCPYGQSNRSSLVRLVLGK